jgi:hypothetical protein
MAVFLQQAVAVAPAAANTIAFAISAKPLTRTTRSERVEGEHMSNRSEFNE